MKFRMITQENVPCWYELSFVEDKKPAIILRVHKEFITNLSPIPKDAPIIKLFMEEFKFRNFIGTFNKNFGFDDSFRRLGEKKNFVEFAVEIPKSKTSWQSAYAISASFTVFTGLAKFLKVGTSAPFPQLMTIKTVTKEDMCGGSLSGEFSIPLVRWLVGLYKKNSEPIIPEIIEAMKIAYRYMVGLRRFDQFDFRARVAYEYGWLNISCPGNAAGLHPDDNAEFDMKRGLGYEFCSHNVDTPVQQITLLAGLATLHDQVRESNE